MPATKKTHIKTHTTKITVPATTSNFGPGFDAFGAALNIFNTVEVRTHSGLPQDDFTKQAADAFFRHAGITPCGVSITVRGRVPRSRGLGSSVTVRAGIICGLNKIFGSPLSRQQCLQIVTRLEGHPDNATPAFLGGFTICCGDKIFQTPVGSELRFIAVVPDFEVQTATARRLLPSRIKLADAVANVRHSSLIAAAFATGHYALLHGAFDDRFHQPYRKRLIPGYDELEQAAYHTGALGFFLSGSGSTVIALTDSAAVAKKISPQLCDIFKKHRIESRALLLRAHNEPLQT
jgi:homoserine kinase